MFVAACIFLRQVCRFVAACIFFWQGCMFLATSIRRGSNFLCKRSEASRTVCSIRSLRLCVQSVICSSGIFLFPD